MCSSHNKARNDFSYSYVFSCILTFSDTKIPWYNNHECSLFLQLRKDCACISCILCISDTQLAGLVVCNDAVSEHYYIWLSQTVQCPPPPVQQPDDAG